MAESAERQARRDLQIAATMSNLSKAIENEDVKFLDRIRTKADVEQLNGILVRAKHNAILKAQKTDPNLRYDNEALRPEREEDILQAEYPYPSMHKDWVKNLAQEGANKPGLKATSAKLMKRYFAAAEKGWRVDFQDEKDIDELRNYANRLKETGKDNRTPYSAQQALEEIRNYDRIKKLDITNATELRAALREFLQYRGEKKQADPIKQLERDLVGNKIEGFFPTPKDLADRVVRQADIKDGMRVLEPSAGSGALADAVTRAKGDKVELQTIEQQGKLADLLQAKGYKTRQDNFLDLQDEEYDRIIMNPPFENGQDIDHVQHAYNRLAPGGKLVAIMSEGPFFRGDKKASEFRDWLNGRGASEKLPEGSFKNSDRSTGVSTRLVTIEKPAKKSQESKLLSTPEVDPTPPTKSPTPELKLSDLKNSDDRLKYAQQELAEAKRSGDKKRVADWEEEEKRARMTRLKEDQKKQKEKQTSLFDPLAYDSNSPLLRALYSDEVSSTRFSILYPHLAEFRGGYECGGTFIPATRKCWTDPKSGAKLKVPFGYKEYTKRRASAWKKAQSGGQLDESDRRLIASTERLQRKVTGKKEKAELTRAAASAGARQILSSGIAEVDPKRVAVDAQRFQYKILGAQTKSGSVGSLSGVRKWDPNLAGIVQLWRDPKDGKSYVINGHNRLDLAKQLNVPKITAKFIKAQSPEEARAVGAMTNIAEGRGTPIDAAKFFRDSGLSKQDLDRKGIPMRERIATDGLALSKLSDPLFGRVVQGELPEQRAVTIGATLTDHQQQNELVKLIDSKEKRGKKIDNDTIQELSQMVADAPKKEESQGGLFDLLGFSPETRSLAVEKAQIQAGIKKQLARERKLFGTVGKSRAASELEKAGNKINVEESAEISEVATKALEAFDKEKNLSGRVSSALNRAAERLADGENSAKIQREVYDEVLANLQETYRFGKRSGSGRVESISERRKNQNQGDLFAASKAPFPIAQFGGGAGCTCEAPSLRLKRRGHKLKRRRSRQ
jgi:phospholipid N-methyltransferase